MASTYTGVSAKIVGLRPYITALEKLGVDVQDLKVPFRTIGVMARNHARFITRDRTGNLDRGIRNTNQKNKAIITSRATVSVNQQGKSQGRRPYHRYVHFGSKHNKVPLPYMAMAAQRTAPYARDIIAAGIETAIRNAGLR